MKSGHPDIADRRGFFSGIVVRLRLVLSVMAIVVAAACAAAYVQTTRIDEAKRDLVEKAVPLLELARLAGNDMSRTIIAFERAVFTDDPESLDQIIQSFRENHQTFETRVQALFPALRSDQHVAALQDHLNTMVRQISELVLLRTAYFEDRAQLLGLKEEVETLNSDIRETLRQLTFANTMEIENLLSDARSGTADVFGNLDVLFSTFFLTSLNLTGLSLDIETAVDLSTLKGLSQTESNLQSQQLLDSNRAHVAEKFKRIVTQLSQLPAGRERQQLAISVRALQEALTGPEGVFVLHEKQQSRLEKLSALRNGRDDAVQAVTREFSSIADLASADVVTAGGNLDQAIGQLSLYAPLVFAASLLFVVATNWFIVERQVNRRMLLLGQAVENIARGRTAHPATLNGNDELSEISHALEVFRRNAEELRRSNTDLEQFAYVAAHDLRAPLRAVHDLAQWTIEDENNALSAESQDYLGMIQQRTGRLNRLLTDLLDYARAGQENSGIAETAPSEIVTQTAAMLNAGNGFEIRYEGPDTLVMTRQIPLRQILLNLLSNAIKHHDRQQGVIVVRSRIAQGRIHIEVEDDGPGVPPEYQERIFGLFQTLKSRDETEGSGMGLAIIRKLLKRYNGKISVDSDPARRRGSVFRFDLPAQPTGPAHSSTGTRYAP